MARATPPYIVNALLGIFLLNGSIGLAQSRPAGDSQHISLWPGRAPGAVGDSPADVPTLTLYLLSNAAQPMTGVIIIAGGGYKNVAQNSGKPTAAYLNSLGVAAFELTYRVAPTYRYPTQLADAQRAIRTVRAHAAEWNIAPDRVGVMGFSSGGHLAATVSTHFDEGNAGESDPVEHLSSRPDFTILASARITYMPDWGLLDERADPALVRSLSNDTQVTSRTPPTFIFSTYADTVVPAEDSLKYFMALRKAGVPAELHIFKNGSHGIAAREMQDPVSSEWPHLLANWMRVSGFIK